MSEEWLRLLPDQQLYSLIVPMGFDPYNILIFWISAYPPQTQSYFLVTDPWLFTTLSNQPFDKFKTYALPLSSNRILATWKAAVDEGADEYLIYVENMYLLRQMLFNNADIIQFIKTHRKWRFLVLSSFGQDMNDKLYIEQQLETRFLFLKSNLRSSPIFKSELVNWNDIRLWLITLSTKALMITDSNRLSELHLNFRHSYVYSELPKPEGINNWGLGASDWLSDSTKNLLITSSSYIPPLFGVRILIIDRNLDTNQYLTIMHSLIRPSMDPDIIKVYFISEHSRLDIRSELQIIQTNFWQLINSARYTFSSNGHRKIKIQEIDNQ